MARNRLDDYRREEIGVRRARQILLRAPWDADPSEKAQARAQALQMLRRWSPAGGNDVS